MQELVEGLRFRLVPAPKMKRFLAICIDFGLIGLAFYAFLIVAVFAVGGIAVMTQAIGTGAGIGYIIFFVFILLLFVSAAHGYFIYLEYKTGTTLGKRVFGLKVVSVDGQRLSLRQVVIRELLRSYIDIPLLFPALISVFATAKSQRVGDLAANTMVVHSKAKEDSQQFLYVKQDDYLLLLEHLKPGPVPEEFREAYLRFAYQEYLVRLNPAPQPLLEDWVREIKKLLPQADSLGLNQQTILRFFAEYCFQSANKEIEVKRSQQR